MTRREDRFTNTPEDAAAFEARRSQDTYDDPRPSLADCIRDDPVCPPHLWDEHTWVCRRCAHVCGARR